MRVKTITYAMLRKTTQYENDRAEVSIEVNDGDSIPYVMETAKTLCEQALKVSTPAHAAASAKKSKIEKVRRTANNGPGSSFLTIETAERIVDALEEP